MKRYVAVILLLFCISAAHAQFNDSTHYYLGFRATGSYNRTVANEAYLFNNSLRFSLRKKDINLNSNTKWLYGQQNRRLTNNDVSSLLDFNLYKTFPHFYYWGLLNYSSIYSLRINSQMQGGLGIAYNFFEHSNFVLNLSDGIIYDYSNIVLSDSTSDVYGSFRNSARIQIKWNIKDRVIFNGNTFLQSSLNYGNDYIVKADASLNIKVRKWLGLTATYSYNKMSRTGAETTLLTYGITLEHYF